MRVSGFTVIRNAQIMGYPIVESIRSILPIVDEFVIGVGQSDDNTKGILQALQDPKIKLFDSHWDTKKTTGGLILSEKTNEALDRCTGDWCFYLQADEVDHEEDLPAIKNAMEHYLDNPQVEALLFNYVHFYGSYNVVATARNWYRKEVRLVKKSAHARSFGDAQGFRVNDRKPFVAETGGRIFHYGWVKPPQAMAEKNKHMFRWWHGNKYDESFKDFAYKTSYGLRYFTNSHPKVMEGLVSNQDWNFKLKSWGQDWNLRDVKNMLSDILEKMSGGHRIGEHKNYELLKTFKKE